MKNKKTVLLALAFFLFFFGSVSARDLEITYPTVGTIVPAGDMGLGLYIKYLFLFIFVIVGAAFFMLLVYNGVKYMTSSGDVEGAGSAMKGIRGAFLGVIILFASVLILQTINPGPFTIDIEEPGVILPLPLPPGAYVCNYEFPNIGGIIAKYESGNTDQRIEATQEYHETRKLETEDRWCLLLNGWIDVTLEGVRYTKNTYFVIPYIETTIDVGGVATDTFEYKHGVIFFDKKEGLRVSKKDYSVMCETYIGNPPGGYTLRFGDFGIAPSTQRALSVYPIKINTDLTNLQEITFYSGYNFSETARIMAFDLLLREILLQTNPFFGAFTQRPLGTISRKDTTAIRSVEMTDDIILIFKVEENPLLGNGHYCHVIESDTGALDANIPTRDYFLTGGGLVGGFENAIYFDSIEIIRGRLMK